MRYILYVLLAVSIGLLGLLFATNASAAAARTPASVVALVTPTPGHVACAGSWDEWHAVIDASKLPFGTYFGFTWPGKILLSPLICAALNSTNPELRGQALNIIAHEAIHLTGNLNEQYAACRGLYWAPILAHLVFKIKYRTALMRRYVAGSRKMHLSLSPLYRTGPGACP